MERSSGGAAGALPLRGLFRDHEPLRDLRTHLSGGVGLKSLGSRCRAGEAGDDVRLSRRHALLLGLRRDLDRQDAQGVTREL